MDAGSRQKIKLLFLSSDTCFITIFALKIQVNFSRSHNQQTVSFLKKSSTQPISNINYKSMDTKLMNIFLIGKSFLIFIYISTHQRHYGYVISTSNINIITNFLKISVHTKQPHKLIRKTQVSEQCQFSKAKSFFFG